jgi:hypothetical protein
VNGSEISKLSQQSACVDFHNVTGIKDRKNEVEVMQIQLSPAHPDFGKVGFAELEDRVRQRAYQRYEKRGYAHGHALDDWLQAKAEVLGVTKGDSYLENVSAAASSTRSFGSG